jgi:D-threo-aldose 1-dehydrogenase
MNFVEPLQRFAAEGADVVMVAGRWTLLDRSAASLLDTCRDRDVAVLVAGPFNSGILARPEPPTSGTFDYAPASPDLLSRVRAMAEACLMYGTTLPAAALQYTLRHPAVARVIAGFRSSDEVTQAVRGLHEPIPDALWDQLDGVLR